MPEWSNGAASRAAVLSAYLGSNPSPRILNSSCINLFEISKCRQKGLKIDFIYNFRGDSTSELFLRKECMVKSNIQKVRKKIVREYSEFLRPLLGMPDLQVKLIQGLELILNTFDLKIVSETGNVYSILGQYIDYSAFPHPKGNGNAARRIRKAFDSKGINTYAELLTYINDKGSLQLMGTENQGIPDSIVVLPGIGYKTAKLIWRHLKERNLQKYLNSAKYNINI